MSKQNGLTLIELIVILVIVVALALIAIPNFVDFIKNRRLAATADNLYYALQYARSEAVKRNTSVYVSFQTGDTWCYGINTGSACNCTVANNCNLGTTSYENAQQITLSVTGLSSNSAQFEAVRAAATTSGTVTFTLYGLSRLITVSISRLGSIQMCSTGISGYTAC